MDYECDVCRIEKFNQIVGKTIETIDSTSINVVTIKFTDGSEFSIDCDEQHYGIGVLQITSANE